MVDPHMKITVRCRHIYMLIKRSMLSAHVEERIVLDSVVPDLIRMDPRAHGRPWSDELKPRVRELLMQE